MSLEDFSRLITVATTTQFLTAKATLLKSHLPGSAGDQHSLAPALCRGNENNELMIGLAQLFFSRFLNTVRRTLSPIQEGLTLL
jgi:hypothetical protein